MLALAFTLLCAAVAIGCGLAFIYMRGPDAKPPPAALPVVHAAFGAASLLALIAALRRGVPQSGMGIADFGVIALVLLALTLAFGVLLALASWRRGRPGELLVGTHAGLAVAGFVILMTLVALR
jgi:hypothetical protein